MKDYFILKKLCRFMFRAGGGNYWYEDEGIGNDSSALYVAFRTTLFFAYISMTILEVMAATIGDFPNDEHGNSVSLGLGHTFVLLKVFSVMINKSRLRKLNRELVKVCDECEGIELMTEKYKKTKFIVIGYLMTVFFTIFFFISEGIRKMFAGSHFVTVVTYYPQFEDNSYPAVIFRVCMTFLISSLMCTMVSVDCAIIVYLIIFRYKLITLRYYFDGLRKNVENMLLQDSNLDLPTDYLSNGLVLGVKMYQKLLSLSKDVYICFGTTIFLQVGLSICSIVSLLLQLALLKGLKFSAYMKILFFSGSVYALLGLFLCFAGEVTYQASLLSDAVCFSGWHLCKVQSTNKRNLRHLVMISCAQAQRPLIMKGCKMFELTYATFLQVSRTTYSVFALLHTQSNHVQ